MPKKPGLLGNLNYPLLMGGLGLLSQGPSLRPQSGMQGLLPGLLAGSQMQQMQLEREQAEREASAPEYKHVPGVGLVQMNATGGPSMVEGMATPQLKQVWDPETQTAIYAPASEALGQMAPPPSALVNIEGDKEKPLGESAPKWRMPDGTQPPAGLTASQAIALGATPLGPGEIAAQTEKGRFEQVQKQGVGMMEDAIGAYEQAYRTWNENKTPENKRAMSEAAKAAMLARQYAWNQGRELGGPTQRALEPPGPLRRKYEEMFEQAVDWFTDEPAPAPAMTGTGSIQQGQIETDDEGNRWEFMGGDPADQSRWRRM